MNNLCDDFPILNKYIYFDNAATTLKTPNVVEDIVYYYQNLPTNVNRSKYYIAEKTSKLYESTREKVRNYINAGSTSEVIFTSGTTEGINLIVSGYFKRFLKPGDEVLLTLTEHASNVLPWYKLAKEKGILIKYIPLNEDGIITAQNLNDSITDKTKAISLAHVTNTIGDHRFIKEITEIAHKLNIEVLVDGAQAVGHLDIDVKEIDADFYVFSAHKMYGPTGLGIVYGKKELLEDTDPLFIGGGNNISFSSEDNSFLLKALPYKLEAGTKDIASIIAFGKTIDYMTKKNITSLSNNVYELKEYCVSKLKEIENITIYNKTVIGTTIIFNHDDFFCEDVAAYLSKKNILVRAGNHCSKMTQKVFGTTNTVRLSFSFYNSKEEIDVLIQHLENIKNIYNEIL